MLVWLCWFVSARLVLLGWLDWFAWVGLVLLGWLGWFAWVGLVLLFWLYSFGWGHGWEVKPEYFRMSNPTQSGLETIRRRPLSLHFVAC